MKPVDQPYFEWLTSQIEIPVTFNATFHNVFVQLHETPFTWTVNGDENRIQDARDLRTKFVSEANGYVQFKPYISLLEILIVISRQLEWVAGGRAFTWAWQLIDNLGLNQFQDPWDTDRSSKKVGEIIHTLLWRTYDRSGQGGFFPLVFPREDQTKIEIWYQLNAYVSEIVET